MVKRGGSWVLIRFFGVESFSFSYSLFVELGFPYGEFHSSGCSMAVPALG